MGNGTISRILAGSSLGDIEGASISPQDSGPGSGDGLVESLMQRAEGQATMRSYLGDKDKVTVQESVKAQTYTGGQEWDITITIKVTMAVVKEK